MRHPSPAPRPDCARRVLRNETAVPGSSRRGRRASRAGFTIIELVLATFTLTMGIGTAIIGMQSGFRHLDLARGTTIAAQIIQSEMERIRMMSWSGVSALPAKDIFDGALNFTTSSRVAGKYSVTRIRVADATRPTEVAHIDISVTWKTYDGRSHTRSFNSIYTKNGLYDYYYTIAHP
jgi:Tfp pilus assembly protein PilV